MVVNAAQQPRTSTFRHPRPSVGIAGRIAALIVVAALAGCPSEPQTQSDQIFGADAELSVGNPLEYNLDVARAGHYVIALTQSRIEAVLAVSSRAAGEIAVNDPLPLSVRDSVLISISEPDEFAIVVTTPESAAGTGSVRLEVHRLHIEPGADSLRLQAEAAVMAGAKLSHANAPSQRGAAIDHYLAAAKYWKRLGNAAELARAYANLASLKLYLDRVGEALEHYDVALRALRRSPNDEMMGAIYLDRALADIEASSYERARQSLEKSAAIGIGLGHPRLHALSVNRSAVAHHYQGDLERALPMYRDALQIFRDLGDDRNVASLLNNIGGIYFNRGEPSEAFRHFEQSIGVHEAAGRPDAQAVQLGNLASLYRRVGDFDNALQTYSKALRLWEQLNHRKEQARAHAGLGHLYFSLGDWQKAGDYLRRALPIQFDRSDPDRKAAADTLKRLGELALRLREYEAAAKHLQESLSLYREIEVRAGEAAVLGNLAQLSIDSGRAGDALERIAAAFAIATEVGDRRLQATLWWHKGRALGRLGKFDDASESFDEALRLRQATRDIVGEAETHYSMAEIARDQGNLSLALRHTDDALAVLEAMRSGVSNPSRRASLLAARRGAYELRVSLLMARHDDDPDEHHHHAALLASEQARARTLLDFLRETGAGPNEVPDADLRKRYTDAQRNLNLQLDRQQRVYAKSGTKEASDKADQRVADALVRLEEIETRVRQASPQPPVSGSMALSDVTQIQALLGADTVLLEYLLGEQRSFLWVVTDKRVHVFTLAPRAQIEALASEVHQRLKISDPTAAAAQNRAALALGEMILGPAAGAIAGKRLAIVSDGTLHYVPFAALRLPAAMMEPLIKRHEIVMLPSAQFVAERRTNAAMRATAARSVAILADPVFDTSDARLAGVGGTPAPGPVAATRGAGLRRLPHAGNEARAIAELVNASDRFVALGVDANRDVVLDGGLAGYRFVHFATHGVLDSRNPQQSSIELSQFDANGAAREGSLRLHDIRGLRFDAELAVLSGCDTALGERISGEGLVGLTRGFLYAGVPAVVASLWQVSDRSTAELMVEMYHSLLVDGLRPAAALRRAQLAVYESRTWRDPYYWGAFVLQGDWR